MSTDDTDTNLDTPPYSEEHPFERDGRTAVLRYTPEDSTWNVFTPDGVYVAALTRLPAEKGSGFLVDGRRTGPTSDGIAVADSDWAALVVRALEAADRFEP